MGIGEAIAEQFIRQGATVVLAARQDSLLAKVAGRLNGISPGHAIAVTTDVTVPDQVARLAEQSFAQTGRVDVLVNNAGVGVNGKVETLDLDAWRRCLEVNLIAPVQVIQAFLPRMKAAGGGSIVQISSVLGKLSAPGTAGYNASKFALNAVSDALRNEVAGSGIRVISVYPGSTESNFRANSLGETRVHKVRFARVPASLVGQRVVRAVERGERDVYITARDAVVCWLATRMPGLADKVIQRLYGNR